MMGEVENYEHYYKVCLVVMYVMCPTTWLSLQFLTAPYGKHSRPGWGPTIPSSLAWFLMESPTLWLTSYLLFFYFDNDFPTTTTNIIIIIKLIPFLVHYTNRTIIYPLRNPSNRPFPVSVALMAFSFNLLNAFLQTTSIFLFQSQSQSHLRMAVGLAVFAWGMSVNISSDHTLMELKRKTKGKGGGGYSCPKGGWFDLVASPNYMGEVTEWLGWAIMLWSPAAFAFFLYTCANLVPRAAAHRRWYLQKFPQEFPSSRKAIFPYLY